MKKIFTLALMCMLSFAGFSQDPGTFDESFGNDGIARFAPSATFDFIEDVMVQADGKIVTVGKARESSNVTHIYISRQNADGSIDETYGTNGYAYFKGDELAYYNSANAAVMSEDGLLYIAGHIFDYEDNRSFVLCVDENGFEYPYFGDNGFALSQYGGGVVYEDIDLDSHGRPIVTGYLNDTILVRRYNAVGLEDPSFGTNGTVQIPMDNAQFSFGYAIEVLDDDKILVAGTRVDVETQMLKTFVCRLKANGSMDTSFGNNGVLDLNVGPYAEFPNAISVQPDGKYLVAGHSELPSQSETLPRYESYIARITTNGTIDNSFGTDGFTRFESFSGEGCVNNTYAITTDAEGQIFGTYYSYNFETLDSRAYIYNLDVNGQPKESFAGTGVLPISLMESGDREICTMAITLQEDGKLLVGGYIYYNDGYASDIIVARIYTDIEGEEVEEGEAAVELEVSAIDAHNIKAIVTPNEYTTEYHIGYVSKEMFDQTGAEMLAQALQSDGNPQTEANEFTYGSLTPETEYVVLVTAKNEANEWIIETANVTTPEAIGFAEVETTQFNIYPNPATSTVFVETSMNNAQVNIIDLTGRCVISVEMTNNTATINVDDINNGVYFIMIQNESDRIVEKLIVK